MVSVGSIVLISSIFLISIKYSVHVSLLFVAFFALFYVFCIFGCCICLLNSICCIFCVHFFRYLSTFDSVIMRGGGCRMKYFGAASLAQIRSIVPPSRSLVTYTTPHFP